MASVNKVILIGNLTRDPEIKYIPSGTAVCEFSIAINETWKDKSGVKKESVTFVNVKAWGKPAEFVGEYLRKGASVFIDGKLTVESWDDKATGQKRQKMLVTAERVQGLGGKRDTADTAPADDSYAADAPAGGSDVPF